MSLTRQQYFHAFALFVVARRKQAEVVSLQKDIAVVLGISDSDQGGTHVDDAIYAQTTQRDELRDFNYAMQKMGYTWESADEEISRITGAG